MPSDCRLNGGAIDRPHPPSHAHAGSRDRNHLAAAIIGVRAPLHVSGLFQAVDQAREIILRQQHRTFELERPQAAAGTLEFKQRIVPSRSWIEFGSAVLNDIAGFYGAVDETPFMQKVKALANKFERLEARLELRFSAGPYFDGERFSLVDAVFSPVFRYFDIFDRIGEFGVLAGKSKVLAYRQALAARPSVRAAVASDYNSRLWTFLRARNSQLSRIMAAAGAHSAAAVPASAQ